MIQPMVPPDRVLLNCQSAPDAKSSCPSPSMSLAARQAVVVLLGSVFHEDVLAPSGFSEPEDALAVDDDDVQGFVGIHIEQANGIADAEPRRELLPAKVEIVGLKGRKNNKRSSPLR